MPHHSKTPIGP